LNSKNVVFAPDKAAAEILPLPPQRLLGLLVLAYNIERTTDLVQPVWTVLATTNAPASGVWEYLDADAGLPAAFYRARQHWP